MFFHIFVYLCRCVPRRECPHSELVARWRSRVTLLSNQCTDVDDVIPSRLLSLSRAVNVSYRLFSQILQKNNILIISRMIPQITYEISTLQKILFIFSSRSPPHYYNEKCQLFDTDSSPSLPLPR